MFITAVSSQRRRCSWGKQKFSYNPAVNIQGADSCHPSPAGVTLTSLNGHIIWSDFKSSLYMKSIHWLNLGSSSAQYCLISLIFRTNLIGWIPPVCNLCFLKTETGAKAARGACWIGCHQFKQATLRGNTAHFDILLCHGLRWPI